MKTFYYHLKMIDNSETDPYSDIIAVVFKNERTFVGRFVNPVKGLINIQFDNTSELDSQIRIINIFNQAIITIDINEKGQISKTLDVSALPKGLYFVQIKSSIRFSTVKIDLQ